MAWGGTSIRCICKCNHSKPLQPFSAISAIFIAPKPQGRILSGLFYNRWRIYSVLLLVIRFGNHKSLIYISLRLIDPRNARKISPFNDSHGYHFNFILLTDYITVRGLLSNLQGDGWSIFEINNFGQNK